MCVILLELLGVDITLIKWDRRLGREQNNSDISLLNCP